SVPNNRMRNSGLCVCPLTVTSIYPYTGPTNGYTRNKQSIMQASPQVESQQMEQAFADSARDFLQTVTPLTRLRALRDSTPGYEREIWQKMAEAGWTGLLVPEDQGGLELGLGAAAAVAVEVGKHPLPEPYLPSAIHAAAALAALPASALRNELL